jgi:hypothetical protein
VLSWTLGENIDILSKISFKYEVPKRNSKPRSFFEFSFKIHFEVEEVGESCSLIKTFKTVFYFRFLEHGRSCLDQKKLERVSNLNSILFEQLLTWLTGFKPGTVAAEPTCWRPTVLPCHAWYGRCLLAPPMLTAPTPLLAARLPALERALPAPPPPHHHSNIKSAGRQRPWVPLGGPFFLQPHRAAPPPCPTYTLSALDHRRHIGAIGVKAEHRCATSSLPPHR